MYVKVVKHKKSTPTGVGHREISRDHSKDLLGREGRVPFVGLRHHWEERQEVPGETAHGRVVEALALDLACVGIGTPSHC